METRPDLATELAQALSMLFTVATDERTQLEPRGDLYTALALSLSREALTKAAANGLLLSGDVNESLAPLSPDMRGGFW